MSRRAALFVVLLALGGGLSAQAASADLLFVRPTGEVLFPLDTYRDTLTGQTKSLYATGFAAGTALDVQLLPWLVPFVRGQYGFVPYAGGESLRFAEGSAGLGLVGRFSDRFSLRLDAQVGLAEIFLPEVTGTSFSAAGRLGFDYRLAPAFTLSAGGGYSLFAGSQANLLSAVTGGVSVRYNLNALGGEKARVSVESVKLEPVFPSLYAYYDDHAFGSVTVRNAEDGAITNLRVSFNAGHYMDQPKVCGEYEELAQGGTVTVPVLALFTDAVLNVTQGLEVKGEIVARYSYLGSEREIRRPVDFRMHHRNAISWADDRRAAAFVSPNNPAALWFSKFATGVVNDRLRADLNRPLQYAMGLFEAQRLYGLNYVVVPANDYSVKHELKDFIDSVQFPHQTIINRGGDCSDLAILFASLMESVGVETAFITAPGHIFAAFDTGLDPAAARKAFSDEGLLIFRDGKAWIPIEITMVKDGFLKAWRVGAKEWIDNERAGTVAFYRLRDCWEEYPSAAFPDVNPRFVLPTTDAVVQAVDTTLDRYVQREIVPQAALLETQFAGAEPRARANELGVLYATYGLLAQAKGPLTEAARAGLPGAWDNLANLAFVQQDYRGALALFQHAQGLDAADDVALLGIARCQYELEDFRASDLAYAALRERNPDLASRFGYLGSIFGGEGRAFSLAERFATTNWVRSPAAAFPARTPVAVAPRSRTLPPRDPLVFIVPVALPVAAPPPTPELVPEAAPELPSVAPVAEAVVEPEPIVEPAPQVAPEPAAEVAPDLVDEPVAAPIVEPEPRVAPDPIVEPVVEPVAATEPVPEPVATSLVEPVAEPEPVAEAVVEPAPEPIAEPPLAPIEESAPVEALPVWTVLGQGLEAARPALGRWSTKGPVIRQADATQFFAKLLAPVPSQASRLRYSFEARSTGRGWVGLGLHVLVDAEGTHRGYGEGTSWLVWLTRDPVHFRTDATRVQIYRSTSDVSMDLITETPVKASVFEWNRFEVEVDSVASTIRVRLNGSVVVTTRAIEGLGQGSLVGLRTLDTAEFQEFTIEAEQ